MYAIILGLINIIQLLGLLESTAVAGHIRSGKAPNRSGFAKHTEKSSAVSSAVLTAGIFLRDCVEDSEKHTRASC